MRTETALGRGSPAEKLRGIEPIWYTSRETEKRLNISDSTLKRLEKIGALNALPLGRERRFLRKEVEGFAALGVDRLLVIADRLAALSQRNRKQAARNNRHR
jgi:excisionase family DNA binding protein